MAGKRVGTSLYLHRSAITEQAHWDLITACCALYERDRNFTPMWTVFKLATPPQGLQWLSLLDYPYYEASAWPALRAAYTFIIGQSGKPTSFTVRHYQNNPPILHRKELLLPDDHPRQAEMRAFTRSCEDAGLFKHAHTIGHLANWELLLRTKRLHVHEGQLKSCDEGGAVATSEVEAIDMESE
jgi:hypothetical protein